MLNKVFVIGRLGKPVEVKYGQSGNAIANMTVATDESYTDKSGQRQSVTEWHRVVVYGKTAENCGQFLDKGSLVFVEGRLRTRKWTDRAGQERYTTEIIADRVQFLERRETERQYSEPESTPAQSKKQYEDMMNYQRQAKQAQLDDMGDMPF